MIELTWLIRWLICRASSTSVEVMLSWLFVCPLSLPLGLNWIAVRSSVLFTYWFVWLALNSKVLIDLIMCSLIVCISLHLVALWRFGAKAIFIIWTFLNDNVFFNDFFLLKTHATYNNIGSLPIMLMLHNITNIWAVPTLLTDLLFITTTIITS